MSNIKEQIRQEIERLMRETNDTQFEIGERYMCRTILDFIDSLPEEKPSEDLNDEIKKFIEEYGYERGGDKLLIAIVARHFAEWQKEQMMDEWLKDRDGCFWDGVNEGKKAMEEQMMKDAVEGEIGYWNQRGLSIRLDQSLERLGYGEDTKVKIIIVKED